VAILDASIVTSFCAKPMSLDPLFWRICSLSENTQQPLSFRHFGVWTCDVPPLAALESTSTLAEVDAIARQTLSWSDAQLSGFGSGPSIEKFIEILRDHLDRSARGTYLDTLLTTLILVGNDEAVRQLCDEAKARGWRSRFFDPEGSYSDRVVRWLDNEASQRVVH
jgi:hypothetical protein